MEQFGHAIERLLTDESLTADLDDASARALLRWGQEQIQTGRPEEIVRTTVKVLARLVGKRATLAPAEARARLGEAGLSLPEAALAELWATGAALPDGAWAEKLILTLNPSAPPSSGPPAPSSPPPGETRDPAPGEVWWRRLLFWRKRL